MHTQIGLDREAPLDGRPADVRRRVERVDVPEDDRLELGGLLALVVLDAVEDRTPEPPLDRGMDRCALLLDDRLDASLQLIEAPPDGHREEREHLAELDQAHRPEIPGIRRGQLERADRLVLVVQRRDQDVADPLAEQRVLVRGPPRVVDQVVHDERPALGHGALMDGPLEVAHPEVLGVREDAAVLHLAVVVQDEHAPVLERGQAEAQRRPPEERPQLVLELPEALARDDRLFVDQVPLDRGEHLLVRHVGRPHDDEPGERERVGRQPLREKLVDGRAPEDLRSRRLVERRQRTERPHLDEARVELDPEVPLEAGLGVARGDDQRVVDLQRHAVVRAQDRVVSVEEAPVGSALGAHVHPTLEHPVGIEQETPEARSRVNGAQLEGDGGGHVVAVPGTGREHPGHEHRDQLVMLLDDRQIVDPASKLGRRLEAPAHGAGDVARDTRLGGRGFPRRDQRIEAQLTPVREGRRGQGQLVTGRG